jgi:electron transfer flavoprotein beta subunit
MNIFVCIKQVPDTETRIKLTSDGQLDLSTAKWVVNPYDEFAIEEAVKTVEAGGGKVTAVCLGPKARTVNALRTALAMGCDEAIAIDAPEDLDSLSTAKALKKAIEAEGKPDLIFTGTLAIDDQLSAVSQMLGELMGIPYVVNAVRFQKNGDVIEVEREIGGGAREVYEVHAPVLVAANKGLNKPRFASLPGIMKAKKKPLKEVTLADLQLGDLAPRLSFHSYQMPKDKEPCQFIQGDPKAQVSELVRKLREEAKVL